MCAGNILKTKMYSAYGLDWVIAGILVLFGFIFWSTSKQERCWYRRYILPLMVASFALVLENLWAKLAVLASSILIYEGYRGYGKAVKEKNTDKE
jgi:hypothetical protein